MLVSGFYMNMWGLWLSWWGACQQAGRQASYWSSSCGFTSDLQAWTGEEGWREGRGRERDRDRDRETQRYIHTERQRHRDTTHRETETMTDRDRHCLRLGLLWAFETSTPTLSDTLPPTRPQFLILPKTVPPRGNQTFKYISQGPILIELCCNFSLLQPRCNISHACVWDPRGRKVFWLLVFSIQAEIMAFR